MVTYPVPFCSVTVYESANRFYLVGSDVNDRRFCLLKIDRTESKELVFSNGDHEYSRKELNELLAMIHGGNASASKSSSATYVLTERVAKAKGILGFVRFLEGFYMIVITKASRVAQLGFHCIYKVEETEMIYIPAKTDSQQSNAEEQRYVKLFQSVDLATNFYFSYTYDLTRTLQENISRPDRTELCEKYAWNSYLLEPMIGSRVNARWILPVVHGYLGTCSLSIKGFTFNLLLLARRSNKFAGTRFLKRGANNKGYVANEVETEQIAYDASISSFLRGRFTSFVQLRGSVPLVWSQDLTKVVGKPPIQLDAVDPFAVIPALHFQDLRTRYSDPIIVINLMKRRERRRHESVLSDEFRTSISYLNQFLEPNEAILYLSFDMARCHKTGSVLPKLEEIAYNVLKLNGWFQTFAPLYFHTIQSTGDDEAVNLRKSGRFLLQSGIPRTNCVDCLDRTNVAQFIIGKVALTYQLYALGLLNEPRLGLETEVCRLLETLYEQHGDTLALQYAGSQLVHSIRTYKKISLFQERSRDVIQTLSRYYSNTFSDHEKQNAINLFLGLFRPSFFKQHLWDLYSDSALHNPYMDVGVSEVDYCAWYELPDDYWKSRIIPRELKEPLKVTEILEKEESEWQLTDFDRYYRTYELTALDALVVKEQREMVPVESPTSPPTVSVQPFMRLWKKSESNGWKSQMRMRDGKRVPRQQRAAPAGEEQNDQEETSSEEEGTAAHSDTEIQYSTPWYGARMDDTPDRQSVKSTYETDTDISLRKPRVDGRAANFLLKSMVDVYGTEISLPSKKDMLKYEWYVGLGMAYRGESEQEGAGTSDGRLLDEGDSAQRQLRARRFLLADQQQQQNAAESRSSGVKLRPFDYDALHSLSIFTNDSSFGVEAPVVSESARQKYANCVRCASEGPRMPSSNDCRIYSDYSHKYHLVVRGSRK